MPTSTVVILSGTTWQVPKSWNSSNNSVTCIGGGAGAAATTGAGGGGGARAITTNVSLTPGATISVAIGAGGTAGSAGGDTNFNSGAIIAKGGSSTTTATGGAGGSAAASTGTTKYSGGNGGNATTTTGAGAGGGGAAGSTANGSNGGNSSGAGGVIRGAGGAGGATGGAAGGVDSKGGYIGSNYAGGGGSGANPRFTDKSNVTTFYEGYPAGAYGAGGGGGSAGSPTSRGAAGAQGCIVITWTWTATTTPASGTISSSNINSALGFSSTLQNSLDDSTTRTLLGVASGSISMSSGYSKVSNKFAVFGGGFTDASVLATSKYYYATQTNITGTNLNDVKHALSGASGSATVTLFAAGADDVASPIATTSLYTMSNDTTGAGTSITTARNYHSQTGSATIGYIFSGATNLTIPGTFTTSTRVYTYSNNTQAAGTAVTAKWITSAASDITTRAVISGGGTVMTDYVATTQVYTYGTSGVAAGTNLASQRGWHTSIGTSTTAIFCGGANNASGIITTTEKYTYSSGAVAAGSSLSILRYAAGSATSIVEGVIGFGQIESVVIPRWLNTTFELYRYSNDTVSAGSNLSKPRTQTMGPGCTGSLFS
jgi:hypothetical protein